MPEPAAAPSVDWAEARKALRDMVGRLTSMMRSIPASTGNALGEWRLSEVAMHLSQAWVVVPGLARRDLSRALEFLPGMASTPGGSLLGDVWGLRDMTKLGVASDPERNLGVLADRIDDRAAEFFSESAGSSPDDRFAWLVEGSTVTRRTLTCHLLNETIMHGYDMALVAGVPWKIERNYAAIVLAGFVIPVLQALDPRAMVDQDKAAGLHATFDVSLRGGARFDFVFEDGALHVEAPAGRRADCHLSVDPVAMLMVGWNRKSQWPAIARGQFVAWGRKPWLGPRFASLIRSP
ncbi:MAG: hypothetical protein M3011_03375 [Actinomycetota bacterium]|nr:hypothetical protein [Actinomycetota bacterium]